MRKDYRPDLRVACSKCGWVDFVSIRYKEPYYWRDFFNGTSTLWRPEYLQGSCKKCGYEGQEFMFEVKG